MANPFTPGDLVVSVYGRGQTGDTTTYTDNQASPLTLQDISTSGVVGGQLVLPQTTTTVNGVTEYAVSGEYGSSSEGSLSLSSDGRSLTIAGYAVGATTYNNAEASGGSNIYGDPRLAQSTSVPGGQYTPVQRVIADVRADGTVDSSTALYNVYNGNNPRSVVTDNGSSFYISGQGQSGDTTQGVFRVADGATTATAIDTSTDTRSLLIANNGTLYVSRDSKQPKANPADNVGSYGGEPTAAATATPLPGINQTVTLAAGDGNAINGSSGTVHLSPENFFFANATTLYVADSGNPKAGGLGDGGLQKYTLANGTWTLNYTLSAGLNLKADTIADPGSGGQGTTGLIGLTGRNNGDGTVSLYATNSTVGDLNQTYLYGITDTLADTTAAQASAESFATLYTAPADTNVRGVAFAPSVACYCAGTAIRVWRDGAAHDIAVEALAIGDRVVTASGALRPIRWIGRRRYIGRFANANPDLLPVCFKAGAIADNVPVRDLWVSPKHAMFLDGALVPAEHLVNGVSVIKVRRVDEVDYRHVELDSHDVLLAEGAPSESFVEDGDRQMFQNAHEHVALTPRAPQAEAVYCAARLEQGFQLEAIRRRLDARACRMASAA